jgi:hypothetical protein
MTDVTAYLTNSAYGYPARGDARRIPPRRLICIHITGNPSSPPATAMQERDYANRADSGGPSAHSYLNRDGSFVHAIDPVKYAAWGNGVLNAPKTTTPGVAEVIALDNKTVPGTTTTYNPNEDYRREVETCARYSAYPITQAQHESLARIIAEDAVATGLRISRSTVHLHSDLDSVNRPNDPVPAASAETWVAGIIARANDIYLALTETDMTWEELLALVDAKYKEALAAAEAAEQAQRAAEASLAALRARVDVVASSLDVVAADIEASVATIRLLADDLRNV